MRAREFGRFAVPNRVETYSPRCQTAADQLDRKNADIFRGRLFVSDHVPFRVVFPSLASGKLPALADDVVHVWIEELSNRDSSIAQNDLSPNERRRADAFVVPRIRDQFVIARSLLRQALARYSESDPSRIELTVRDDGKPILADSRLGLQFNLSHSHGWFALAISRHDVGIDLEPIRDIPNASDLVSRFFSVEEYEQYQQLPNEWKRDGFLRGWTCKEAVLKGTGAGMRAIDSCAVCLDPSRPPRLIRYEGRPPGERWGLAAWSAAPGMVTALAVEGTDRIDLEAI